MRVFRITHRRFAGDPLGGQGAAMAGARWNSRGVRIGYTAGSRSLALLEMLVHVSRRELPAERVMVAIEIPDNLIVDNADHPYGWHELPYRPDVQRVGDDWVATGSSAVLRVRSALVRDEHNVLVNPLHADARRIGVERIEPLVLDPRLFEN